MICFAFLNPQAIRLLLDRSKYDGVVLPSINDRAARTVTTYTESLAVTHKQVPVFIHQDLASLVAVLRSGRYEPGVGKHILCASVSTLAAHGIEAIDTVSKTSQESDWRVRSTVMGPLSVALVRDVGLDEETITRLVSSPVLEEQKFSNPLAKVEVVRPCIDLREIEDLLPVGGAQNQEMMLAILRYVTWSFVAAQASALGGTHNEIHRSATTKLMAVNNKMFLQYIRSRNLRIPVAVINRARTMFNTSAPATMIFFAHRRLYCKRPGSLAVLESGCSSYSAALIEKSGLTASDFPSLVRAETTTVVPTHNLACVVRVIPAGVYSFTKLLQIIGVPAEHAFDAVRRATSKIKFSRNPVWHENDNCWKITDGVDLYMLFNEIKYRFCTQTAVLPPQPVNRVTATSPVVRISAVRKKAEYVIPSPTVPSHMRVSPLSPGRVVAVKTRRIVDAPEGEPRRLTPKDIARIVDERKPVPVKATKAVPTKTVAPVQARKASVSTKSKTVPVLAQKKQTQVVSVRGSVTSSKKPAPQPVRRKQSR